MARWSDLATWRGNGANQGGRMVEVRGLVLHIAVGWYEGTIAWQRNPDSRVSSHFIIGRESGELAQMVDTDIRAWTQGDGNGRWLSSENEGFLVGDRRNPGGWEKLSPWQVEANAQLLARAHREHGVPLAIATHPGQRGLGHHSMDREWLDEQWGHDECPGFHVVAQKAAIVARAKQIIGGDIVDLSTRNPDTYVRRADGSPYGDQQISHQWGRSHEYGHRLTRALMSGDTRYSALDAVASPGTEDEPRPTATDNPDRLNRSWRYALQRIWRWCYWAYRRAVVVDDRTARIEATLAAQGELLAQIAAGAGLGDRDELIEQTARRAAELVDARTAADVAAHLAIVSVDDQDNDQDDDGES